MPAGDFRFLRSGFGADSVDAVAGRPSNGSNRSALLLATRVILHVLPQVVCDDLTERRMFSDRNRAGFRDEIGWKIQRRARVLLGLCRLRHRPSATCTPSTRV